MHNDSKSGSVVKFPNSAENNKSSTEKIWGSAVYGYGFAGIPSILIQGQRRLGISTTQMNIIIQLLDYWFEPSRKPFPSKKDLANRIGVTPKTIQNNIRELEKAGLINRIPRKTASGDWNSNIYDLVGLIKKVQELEPEFSAERKNRKARKQVLETPVGLRKKPQK